MDDGDIPYRLCGNKGASYGHGIKIKISFIRIAFYKENRIQTMFFKVGELAEKPAIDDDTRKALAVFRSMVIDSLMI